MTTAKHLRMQYDFSELTKVSIADFNNIVKSTPDCYFSKRDGLLITRNARYKVAASVTNPAIMLVKAI